MDYKREIRRYRRVELVGVELVSNITLLADGDIISLGKEGFGWFVFLKKTCIRLASNEPYSVRMTFFIMGHFILN